MLDLKKLFQREGENDDPATDIDQAAASSASIRDGYRTMILEQLDRGGVSHACVEVEVRHLGSSADGRPIFLGMLRLATWERRSAVRMLTGLPILEMRLKRLARNSWLHEVSHFGGVWLHASGQLLDASAMEELRAMATEFEAREGASAPASVPIWSVPPDTGGS